MNAEQLRARRFQEIVIPHLDAAYNLARWLARSDADAQDVVQESCLRAFKYFDGFSGDHAKAWLLKIVRNTWYSWRKRNRPAEEALALEDNIEEVDANETAALISAQGLGRNPETLLIERRQKAQLDHLLEDMPTAYRSAPSCRGWRAAASFCNAPGEARRVAAAR